MRTFGSILLLVFASLVFTLMPQPAVAQAPAPFLQACMSTSNGLDLSSNGCDCNGNADCLGTCSATNICVGGPPVPGCARIGNQLDASSNGCPCTSNNDCRGVCLGASQVCGGGSEPPERPPTCAPPGAAGANGVTGCPCNTSADCTGSCNVATRTCGGLTAAVARFPVTYLGLADDAVLGDPVQQGGVLGGGRLMPSHMQFRIHPAADATCTASLFGGVVNVPAMGAVQSPAFVLAAKGDYRWAIAYAGNAWNLPVATACNDPLQQFSIVALFEDGFE